MTTTLVSLDYEAKLITQAAPVPQPICLALCQDDERELIHARDPACRLLIRSLVEDAADSKIRLTNFNLAFDMVLTADWFDLLEQVFAAYEAETMHCTMVRQKMIDIAKGEYRGYRNGLTDAWVAHNYNLAAVAARYNLGDLDKDTWRLRYAEFDRIALGDWPEGARTYPLEDAEAANIIHTLQDNEYGYLFEDEHRQSYSSFCLALCSAHGIKTALSMVGKYRERVQAVLDEHRDLLIEKGFLKFKKNGDPHKQAKLMQQYAEKVWAQRADFAPRTPTGLIKMDEQAALMSQDPVIIAFQGFSSADTAMGRVDELAAGAGEYRIHTHFDELMESGRTSSSNPNVQNRATKPGDRECIVPDLPAIMREHMEVKPKFATDKEYMDWLNGPSLYIIADFDGLELRTIAQSCIDLTGSSRLGEVLNAGEDPHLMMAATMIGITYDEAKIRYEQGDPEVEDARGAGKAKMANFGFAAGQSPVHGFITSAAKKGFFYTKAEAQQIYDDYCTTWPEMREFFTINKAMTRGSQAAIQQLRSNRHRGMLGYTELCSTWSQGLGADATKAALRALVSACYVGRAKVAGEWRKTPLLHGARAPNYVHDEYHTEIPEDSYAHDRAMEMGALLRDAANFWLPNVPTRAKPILTRRWSKKAKAKYDGAGRLVPWDWSDYVADVTKRYNKKPSAELEKELKDALFLQEGCL